MDVNEELDDLIESLREIEEAVAGQRQNLAPKRWQPHKQNVYRKVERRATRDAGSKRNLNRAGYNAGQRDRDRHKKSGQKQDGTRNTIAPRRKLLGSVINPRKSNRTRLR